MNEKGAYVKLNNKTQINSIEIIGKIQSTDGEIHEFILQSCNITDDNYVYVGCPVEQQRSQNGDWEHLIELPVESTRGHWRIWINPTTQIKWKL